MRVGIEGHRYILDHLDGDGETVLQFVDRDHGRDTEGVTCQEVLRALIDRIQMLDAEEPWEGNADILQAFRKALTLFEVRALMRKVEVGDIEPEAVLNSKIDGHWLLMISQNPTGRRDDVPDVDDGNQGR